MIEIESAVAGERVDIHIVETEEDLREFEGFIAVHGDVLGLDSETTGLDIYSESFRSRLVQFGTSVESWVIPVELGDAFRSSVSWALEVCPKLILHNPAYDLQVFERTLDIPMEIMWPKVIDTKVLAHLVDPSGKEEGGKGHALEALVGYYLDSEVAFNVKGSIPALCKKHHTSKALVWKKVPLFDPDYLLYSGMDPVLAIRLYEKLLPMVPSPSRGLISYEMKLEEICSYMQCTGFLLDVEYTEQLRVRLIDRENTFKGRANDFGVEKINSTDNVADILEALGVKITGRTPSGKRKVDDDFLAEIAKQQNAAGEVAGAIIEAKRASKWRTTYTENFLKQRDSSDRCHASINPLVARTGRMSITGIPAQQLPSSDWMIRRCFLADDGHRVASVDYKAQELRVLASLSGDPTMIAAFLRDEDLHLLTAQAAFGSHITKDDQERKWGKGANFSRVYGGGAKTVADQNHLDIGTAARVIAGFDRAYPLVKVLSAKLQKEAGQTGAVLTPTGRRLPVDPDRAYSALNYVIQSTSRDVTGRALVRLHEAGFTPYLRLPMHDEVVASLPAEKASWGATRIGQIMSEQMGPLEISTDLEVGGRSWGSLYGADY